MGIIEGGKNGNVADVNNQNMLKTFATTFDAEAHEAEEGDIFLVSTPRMSITTVEGLMFYYKNNSTKNVRIKLLRFYWNGGSTNFNRPAFLRIEKDLTLPTVDTVSVEAANANIGLNKTSEGQFLYWNGTGSGMTGHTAGKNISFPIISQGQTCLELDFSVIIAPGKTLGIYAKGEEDGEFCLISRYMESNLEEIR